MATDPTTGVSTRGSLRQECSVESFNGSFTRHEYLQSEGILEAGDETYRVRIGERDDHIQIDVWEGEYDGRSFEPEEYVASTRLDYEDPAEEIPSELGQMESLLEDRSINDILRSAS